MRRPQFSINDATSKPIPWPIPVRLAKYLREASNLSRRQASRAIDQGKVKLVVNYHNDEHPTRPAKTVSLDTLVFPQDKVLFNERAVARRMPSTYVLLHKPDDVVSTVNDPQNRRCLAHWLDAMPDGAFPVGRLDRDTTGLLLFTDDGDLAHVLLHPDFHVPKEYHLLLKGRWAPDASCFHDLLNGVDIGDGVPARALDIRILHQQPEQTLIAMVIEEGRHRQVRRMCKAVHLRLQHLHRARLGPVLLGDIEPGELRCLSEQEVKALWDAAGGQLTARARALAALHWQAQKHRQLGKPHTRLDTWLDAHDPHGHWRVPIQSSS